MERQLTIPKNIRFRFEQFAYDVCERAMIDYSDVPQKLSEFVGYMENRWRRHIKGDFITNDVAADRAIEEFGPVHTVAKFHRGGMKLLWQRLLYYRRYSVNRLLSALAIGSLHWWVIIDRNLYLGRNENGDIDGCLGTTSGEQYFVCVGIILALYLIRWYFGFFRLPVLGKLMAMLVALFAFSRMFVEWAKWDDSLVLGHPIIPYPPGDTFWEFIFFRFRHGLGVLEGPILPFVFILVMAEIYDFKALRSAGKYPTLFNLLSFSWIRRPRFFSSKRGWLSPEN